MLSMFLRDLEQLRRPENGAHSHGTMTQTSKQSMTT
jgi:hypothetical protein